MLKTKQVWFNTHPGPLYPDLGAGVAKYRRMAGKGGVAKMPPAMRYAYGEAVEKAILAKQRSELQRELPTHAPRCPSGCASPDGDVIHRHMQNKQRAALLACPAMERRARTPQQWAEMYEEAMADKRKREADAKLARLQKKPALQKKLPLRRRVQAELRV